MPASRTTEGFEHRCTICGKPDFVIPSDPLADAPCPYCGTSLWPIRTEEAVRLQQSRTHPVGPPIRTEEAVHLLPATETAPESRSQLLARLEAYIRSRDSLDFVELVMQVEDTFQCGLLDDFAKRLHSPEKMVDWLATRLP